MTTTIRAAAEQAQPEAPSGWRMVPAEPTAEMLAAAHEADREYTLRNFGDVMTVSQGPYDHWVAMLAAAPPQAAEPSEAEVSAAMEAIYGAQEEYVFRSDIREKARERIRTALRAAATARVQR